MKLKLLIQKMSSQFQLVLLTLVSKEKIVDKALCFVRSTGSKSVNTSIECDNDVTYAEIPEQPLGSFVILFNQFFAPLLETMDEKDWGAADEETKKEFLSNLKKFQQDMGEIINSLSGTIELQKYDRKFEAELKNTAKNPSPELISHFEDLLSGWIKQINEFRTTNDNNRKGRKDEGPLQELDYWRQRQQTLTSITEQMKSKDCKDVIETLSQGKKITDRSKDSIFQLMQEWKGLEMSLTESLNEARDNVKYLKTLELYIDPLYNGTPQTIIESLPALMNSIKMIFTISKYYNHSESMTQLFAKITYQMIANCKKTITKGRPDFELWDSTKFPPEELIPILEDCKKLNEAYKAQYQATQAKLKSTSRGSEFNFTESHIFGHMDLFCRRIQKLIDLFGTIQQFQILGRHNLEGIEDILKQFNLEVEKLKGKEKDYALFDYSNSLFDRDFVEFTVEVSKLEKGLQQFINRSVDIVHNIEQSVKFLKKFQDILRRQSLKNDLQQKYTMLFNNYQMELGAIQEQYNKYNKDVPFVRNMPQHAGTVMWTRHLLERIHRPLKYFPPEVFNEKESKKSLALCMSIARALVEYEIEEKRRWENSIEKAKEGLSMPLLMRDKKANNMLFVNLDPDIMNLIREAKCMSKMGIEIKESAKIVLLQEEKFKLYYNELDYLLKECERITGKIRSNTLKLLQPHIEDLEYKIKPGMITLTWTSMNIDNYLEQVHQGLNKLEQFIIKDRKSVV